ncbi:YfhO family protein [Candidatus Undinarchaeota archaeon]
MKKISKNRFASFVSALVFMFSGYLLERIHLGHSCALDAIAIFPLIFLLAHIFFERRDLKSATVLGIALGIQMLAGFPVITVYTLLAIILYYLYFVFSSGSDLKSETKKLSLTSLPLILMTGLSAIVILPGLEFLMLSQRGSGTGFMTSTTSFSLANLSHLLMPEFLGTLLNETCYLGGMSTCIADIYVGVLAIVLAAVSLIVLRNRQVKFFAFLSVFSLLYAIARFPLQYVFYYVVPILRFFKGAGWILFLFAFSVSIMAGFGAGVLSTKIKQRDKKKMERLFRVLIVVSIFSIMILVGIFMSEDSIIYKGEKQVISQFEYYSTIPDYLPLHTLEVYLSKVPIIYNQILQSVAIFSLLIVLSTLAILLHIKSVRRDVIKVLIISIILIDIAFLWPKYIQVEDTENIFGSNEYTEFFIKDNSQFRIINLAEDHAGVLTQQRTARLEIQKVGGYNPIIIGRYFTYMNTLFNISSSLHPSLTDPSLKRIHYPVLLDLLNVKYLLTTEPIDYPLIYNSSLEVYRDIHNSSFQEYRNPPPHIRNRYSSSFQVYMNPTYLPRAFFVSKYIIANSSEIAMEELTKEDFDPKEYVILEREIPFGEKNNGTFTEAEIVDYSPDLVHVNISAPSEGLLVLLDSYYPGWNAYVDGKEREVLRANYAFRAIEIEKGTHTIVFKYEPKSYYLGRTISLITLITVILILAKEYKNLIHTVSARKK